MLINNHWDVSAKLLLLLSASLHCQIIAVFDWLRKRLTYRFSVHLSLRSYWRVFVTLLRKRLTYRFAVHLSQRSYWRVWKAWGVILSFYTFYTLRFLILRFLTLDHKSINLAYIQIILNLLFRTVIVNLSRLLGLTMNSLRIIWLYGVYHCDHVSQV